MFRLAFFFLLCGCATATPTYDDLLDAALYDEGFSAIQEDPLKEYLNNMWEDKAFNANGEKDIYDLINGNEGAMRKVAVGQLNTVTQNHLSDTAQIWSSRYRKELREEVAKKGYGKVLGGKIAGRFAPSLGPMGMPVSMAEELGKIVVEVGQSIAETHRYVQGESLHEVTEGGTVDGSNCNTDWGLKGCPGFIPYYDGGWNSQACAHHITRLLTSGAFCDLLKKSCQLRRCRASISNGKWGPCCVDLFGWNTFLEWDIDSPLTRPPIDATCHCDTATFKCCPDGSGYKDEDGDDGRLDGKICPAISTDLRNRNDWDCPQIGGHYQRSKHCDQGWGRLHWGCIMQWLAEYAEELHVLTSQLPRP